MDIINGFFKALAKLFEKMFSCCKD